MAQTVKTLSQLLSELPDNITRDIHPVDVRDVVVSCFPYLAGGAPGPNNDRIDSAGIGAFFDFGSHWFWVSAGRLWYCQDGHPTAAVWVEVGGSSLTLENGPGINIDTPSPATDVLSVQLGQGDLPAGVGFNRSTNDCLAAVSSVGFAPDGGTGQLQFAGFLRIDFDATAVVAQILDNTLHQFGPQISYVSGLLEFTPYTAGGGGSPVSTPFTPGDGLYHFVECGYDVLAGEMWISVDGATRVTASMGWTPGTGADLTLGAQGGWLGFGLGVTGRWDEFAVYNRQLTADECTLLYNSACGLVWSQIPCALVDAVRHYWGLDEITPPYRSYGNVADFLVANGSPAGVQGVCGMRAGCVPVTPPTPPTSIDLPSNPTPPTPPSGHIGISYPGSGFFLDITLPGPISFPLASYWPGDCLQRGNSFGGVVGPFYHMAGVVDFPGAINTATGRAAGSLIGVPLLNYIGGDVVELAVRAFIFGGGSSGMARLGIYDSTTTPGDLYPNNLVADFGDVSLVGTGSTTVNFSASGSASLVPGMQYWLAINCDTSGAFIIGNDSNRCIPVGGALLADIGVNGGIVAVLATGVTYGPLPDPFPSGIGTGPLLQATGGYIPALCAAFA